jgi:hypothetical protein
MAEPCVCGDEPYEFHKNKGPRLSLLKSLYTTVTADMITELFLPPLIPLSKVDGRR